MKRIIILLAVVTLASCGGKKETTTERLVRLKKERAAIDDKIRGLEVNTKDSVKRIPVSVIEVQPITFNSFIDVQSSITGEDNINATPQAPGTVRSVLVHVGQHVGKGQLLATLDAGPIDQQIAALDANINFARTVYQKQQKLWAQQIGTEVQLLQAKANYESASRQRGSLVAQRSMYRVVAPVSGTVDEVNLHVGDATSPGNIMNNIRIVSTGKLKAEASLGEGYLGKVKVGDPVTLIFGTDSMRTRLTFVAQEVNPISRAFNVQVMLPANPRLHPNMSARMKIANYQNSSVITVPINAVQKTGNGDVVYIAVGNIAKAALVRTGRSSNGDIEILNGLNPGDRVIVEGYQDLDEGSAITTQ